MTDTTVTTAAPISSPLAASPPAPAPRNTIADVAYDRLPPDRQSQYARIKDADNNPEWVRRDQLSTDRTTKPAADPTNPAEPAPASDPNARHKFGEMEFSEQELRDFLTAKGEAELRKASLPASPAEYKATLPDNFEMPAGVKFEINETDPLLIDARAWAHSKGLDQATFSEMVGLYASSKAKETAQLNAAHAAEVEKMGANGAQRVSALEVWLRGVIGDELAGPVRSMMVTAKIVKGLETLQRKFSSQGAASFSQAYREPQDLAGRASDAEYAAMSPGQRLDYSRSFDQSQFKDPR